MSKFDEIVKRISEQTGTVSTPVAPAQQNNVTNVTANKQNNNTGNPELDKAIQQLATQLKVDTKVVQQAIATIQQKPTQGIQTAVK